MTVSPVLSEQKITGSLSPLSFRKLSQGARILGIIRDVNDHDMVVSLPSLLTGIISFKNISPLLKNPETLSLRRIYKTGEVIACSITNLEAKVGNYKRMQLSIEPKVVNEGILLEEIYPGQSIMGTVASKEDSGFLVNLDLASRGISGFLPFKVLPENETNLIIGKSMLFSVKSKSSLLITLELVSNGSVCKVPKLGLSERCLIPGAIYEIQASKNGKDKFVSFASDSLKGQLDTLSKSDITEISAARLIYSDPSNNRYVFSPSPHIMNLCFEKDESFTVGCFVDSAKIIKSDKSKGVLFKLAPETVGFSHISKLSDEKVEKIPILKFKHGSVHRVRVISFDLFSGVYQVSMRDSDMDRKISSYEELKPGQLVRGVVQKVQDFGLLILLKGELKAVVPKFHYSPEAIYKVGSKVKGVVVDCMDKRVTVSLSPQFIEGPTLSCFSEAQVGSSYFGRIVSIQNFGAIVRFLGNAKGLLPLAEMSTEYVKDPFKYVKENEIIKCSVVKCDSQNQKLILSLKDIKPKETKIEKEAIQTSQVKDMVIPVKRKVPEILKEESTLENPKKKSLRDFIDQEKEELEEKEVNYSVDNTSIDETKVKNAVEGFEKKLIAAPNSSILWIEYISSLLKLGDISSARKIAERAIQTISYREEEDRKNVWIAYLNLECFYGTTENLHLVFDRAVSQNDPLEIHLSMASILSSHSLKREETKKFYQSLTKKFKESLKAWLAFANWMMPIEPDTSHQVLTDSLKALPKKNHIEMTLQFALLEYSQGEPRRGRTLFEGIIASYPKRLDVWLVYLAQEQKKPEENINQIRVIYERLLSQSLSTKKAKHVFKQYLDFEKTHGNVQTVEHVKQLAVSFVESKTK
jgi:ribosomal protein S1